MHLILNYCNHIVVKWLITPSVCYCTLINVGTYWTIHYTYKCRYVFDRMYLHLLVYTKKNIKGLHRIHKSLLANQSFDNNGKCTRTDRNPIWWYHFVSRFCQLIFLNRKTFQNVSRCTLSLQHSVRRCAKFGLLYVHPLYVM